MSKAKSPIAKPQQHVKAAKSDPRATTPLWQTAVWDEELIERQWPDPPAQEAYHGLAGDVVRVMAPHTESSLVALLIQILLCFGNMVGRTAHFEAEGSKHFMNLFAV